MDFDSIIYILLTIVILVISALGSARKRKLQQSQPSGNNDYSSSTEFDNTVERLEQMFTGRLEFNEAEEELNTAGQAIKDEEISREEIPSGKTIPDEISQGELIGQEREPVFVSKGQEESYAWEEDSEKPGEERREVKELFSDFDEIKRAVIYSEIFKRKYI